MKIVFFDINRLSFEGGAEKYFTEVGEEMSKQGNQVFFIGDCRILLKLYIWLGVFLFVNPVWRLPRLFTELRNSPSLPGGKRKYFTHIPLSLLSLVPFSKQRKAMKIILSEADLILIKNEFFEMLLYFLLGIKKANSYLMVFSSIKYPKPRSIRSVLHNAVYASLFYKYLLKKIDKAVVSNSYDRDFLIKNFFLNKEKVRLIPYGLDKNYFAKKNELKIGEGFRVLFVGRMEEQKGIFYLKEIVEIINNDNRFKNISFCLAGSGPLESIIKRLSNKHRNVEYKGQVSSSEVRKLYLHSDLVVITSKWETFSFVCLEAQACGVPVVTFGIPGPKDILSQTKGGEIIPLSDMKIFVEKIYGFYLLKNKNKSNYFDLKNKITKTTFKKFSLINVIKGLSGL